jgi:hypothetical protein
MGRVLGSARREYQIIPFSFFAWDSLFASITVVFFLHCIVSRVHSMHLSYMRDTLWPTPPASGGTGSSPLRPETNAAYLGRGEVGGFFF